jgi:hypothetical protein
MVRNSGNNLENDVDILFTLPLSEFIGARKALSARLKKEGRGNDAEFVTSLAKPPISAWTVNQLYWDHREEFDELIDAGQRFRKAQTSRNANKVMDMRDALDARREALTQLSDLATTLLSEAGHNPSLETLRRITTTLEALSAYASSSDGPTPGRLTKDVDPPGFESLAGFTASAASTKSAGVSHSKKSTSVAKPQPKATPASKTSQLKEVHQAKIADAKVSLQEAKKSLVDARAAVQRLEAQHEKIDREAKDAEKQKREAEQRFKKASAVSEMANRRSTSLATEVEDATKAVADAKRSVEKATKDLETLFRQSPGK